MTATLPNIFQIPKEIFLIFPKRALTFHIIFIYLCAFIIGELKLSGKSQSLPASVYSTLSRHKARYPSLLNTGCHHILEHQNIYTSPLSLCLPSLALCSQAESLKGEGLAFTKCVLIVDDGGHC